MQFENACLQNVKFLMLVWESLDGFVQNLLQSEARLFSDQQTGMIVSSGSLFCTHNLLTFCRKSCDYVVPHLCWNFWCKNIMFYKGIALLTWSYADTVISGTSLYNNKAEEWKRGKRSSDFRYKQTVLVGNGQWRKPLFSSDTLRWHVVVVNCSRWLWPSMQWPEPKGVWRHHPIMRWSQAAATPHCGGGKKGEEEGREENDGLLGPHCCLRRAELMAAHCPLFYEGINFYELAKCHYVPPHKQQIVVC